MHYSAAFGMSNAGRAAGAGEAGVAGRDFGAGIGATAGGTGAG